MKKFYNREDELSFLAKIEAKSRTKAQMTWITGRRRVGKTTLLQKAFPNALYFFVTRKSEALLCEEYIGEIQNKLHIKIYGMIKTFEALFAALIDSSKTRHFTLIIDEFQEFFSVNRAVFSSMQKIWDLNKDECKINLVLCGSVYSLMKLVFENSKEPLFSRATARLRLKEFPVRTLKEILRDYNPAYTNEDLLAFYMVTGGVAKYCELLIDAEAFDFDSLCNAVFSENSLFLDEGKNLLIDEFGKDYGNYFSILTLLSSSKTSRVEIESIMEMQTGGFLERLENDFNLISKVRPVLSKPASRRVKYRITDNFLNFWFRFIYKHRGAIEINNFSYIKNILRRDYKTYSGLVLERYFKEKLAAEGYAEGDNKMYFSLIGTWWESGNQNEIDIAALNEDEKYALIAEVKRRFDKYKLEDLKSKAKKLVNELEGYKVEYRLLSLEDM